MAITYFFTAFAPDLLRLGDNCQGFNTRFFTFNRTADGGLTLASMTVPNTSRHGQGIGKRLQVARSRLPSRCCGHRDRLR